MRGDLFYLLFHSANACHTRILGFSQKVLWTLSLTHAEPKKNNLVGNFLNEKFSQYFVFFDVFLECTPKWLLLSPHWLNHRMSPITIRMIPWCDIYFFTIFCVIPGAILSIALSLLPSLLHLNTNPEMSLICTLWRYY